MKLEKAALVTKGGCLFVGAIAATLAGGLSQTEVASVMGIPVKLVELGCAAISVGCNIMVAFLSTSFGTYKEQVRIDAVRASAQLPPSKPGP